MSHFSKTRHPNRFAVRIKIPRRTRSRSLKPKNCLEGRNDKFTTGNVNGTSALACFSLQSLELADPVLDELLVDEPRGSVVDVDDFRVII